MAFVYMVRCAGGKIYTGMARDIGARLRAHIEKKPCAAKYTRSHPVEELLALFETENARDAARLEYRIKRYPREKKLLLIADPNALGTTLFPLPEDMGVIHAHRGATLAECLAGTFQTE